MYRFSWRELFTLVAGIVIAFLSLKFASELWEGLVGLIAMLLAITSVIAIFFDRGSRRAFAIGFALAMFGYALLVLSGQHYESGGLKHNIETDGLMKNQLPTSRLLVIMHPAFAEYAYFDSTGHEVPNNRQPVSMLQSLPTEEYMLVGHFWWAIFFGCLGGYAARFANARRTSVQPAATQE